MNAAGIRFIGAATAAGALLCSIATVQADAPKASARALHGARQFRAPGTGATSLGAAEDPYANIVARNMFGLVPIPPPAPPAPAEQIDPPPKITPTGIMNIFGRDQALFKAVPKAKPGQPAKEVAYVLGVGERQDDIEVTKIDHEKGLVTFNNHGELQELPLVPAKDTGGASPVAGGGAGAGGPVNPFLRPNNGLNPRHFPARGGVSQPSFGGIANPANPSGANPGASYGGAGGPGASGSSASLNFGANVNSAGIYQPSVEANPMTPEQNVILMEAQRMQYLQSGNSHMASLIPPTPLTDQNIRETTGQNNGQ